MPNDFPFDFAQGDSPFAPDFRDKLNRTKNMVVREVRGPGVSQVDGIVTIAPPRGGGVFDFGLTDNLFAVGAINEVEIAAADDWERDNQGTYTGVNLFNVTRIAYDHAATADQVLYAYYRIIKFDSKGFLSGIGTESRVVIDTPGTCE